MNLTAFKTTKRDIDYLVKKDIVNRMKAHVVLDAYQGLGEKMLIFNVLGFVHESIRRHT